MSRILVSIERDGSSVRLNEDGSPFVAPIPTVPHLRARKSAEITAWRDAADRSTFEFEGKLFQADETSQARITAVAMQRVATGKLPDAFPGFWKAADNSYVPILDVEAWDRFYAAMFNAGAANFARSEKLKQRAARAATAAELDAITWENL